MASTALVVVINGEAYERYAAQLFYSAEKFFHPTEQVDLVVLEGRPGWPDATMYRWHILRDNLPRTNFVYLCDADMVCEAEIGPEILPPEGKGIVATRHPGYVGVHRATLPYETNTKSACYIQPHEGAIYYCGGFVGGERTAVRILAAEIAALIDADIEAGITPCWHDETALNRVLATTPPLRTLSPEMCHPDDSWYYEREIWTTTYERKLVALDKKVGGRAGR